MPGPDARRPRVRPVPLLLAAACLVGLVFAGPLVWTWWQGNQTQAALEDATVALQDEDVDAAREHVAAAREHADRAVATRDGLLGAMWRNLPVLSQARADAVRMTDSVDDLTAVAEEGLRIYPLLTGDEGDLVTNGRVDLGALDSVLASFEQIESRVSEAHASISAVEADAPLIGWKIAEMREEGLEGLEPAVQGVETIAPLVQVLPDLLGSQERRDFLIAILNPAEQLYSGGTPLTFAPMSVEDGRIEMGATQDTATHGVAFRPRYWKKVKGNPFHRGKLRIGTATFAPDWTISGEETLRAWRSLGRRQMDGLIAIDVMALRDLVAITGPLDVPFYGQLTADNFVHNLIGNYDTFPDYRVRHQVNQALVPVFRDRLFQTGQFVEKFQALHAAAEGRHFAIYMRDPLAQRAFAGLGLTGELSDTDHDYLGVFTQNAVPSKTDYWQNRTVTSDVRLAADGSARVTVATEIHNDSTPYPFKGRDPRSGYSTRHASMSIAHFLPRGASGIVARVDDDEVELPVNGFYGRPFVRRTVDFKPQSEHVLTLTYDVPRAARVTTEGLVYKLDVDPQGLVRPSAIAVTVHLPAGFEADGLPEGWVDVDDDTIGWGGPALVSSPSFEIPIRRDG